MLGVTDHDLSLTIDGLDYHPGAAISGTRFVQSLDLKPGHASASGSLFSESITSEDVSNGLWDACRVDVYQVDWQAVDLDQIHLWSGYITELSEDESGRFEAHLASLKADLERPVGRVLQRQCDAVLGDERCGIPANGRVCDQQFQTCRDTFANTDNFRGFPHLPGSDFVLSGPAKTGNTGGAR